VAGLTGHFATGGLDLSALLAYDGSKAETMRRLPGATSVRGRYTLRGWTGDVAVAYALPLRENWALRPQAGLTWIDVRRGDAAEAGSPFALQVARNHRSALFADAMLGISGGQADGARFHPHASIGVRHQIDGAGSAVEAGFVGTTVDFSVAGAARKRTLATAAVGASYDVQPGLAVFAGYRGDYGGDANGHNVTGGVRFAF
jgi:outer membrane autotransporter protein